MLRHMRGLLKAMWSTDAGTGRKNKKAVLFTSSGNRSLAVGRWRLHDRRRSRENFLPVARQRRVDALAVDCLLGALCDRLPCNDLPVPSLGIDRAPGAEVENGRVPVYGERQRRFA